MRIKIISFLRKIVPTVLTLSLLSAHSPALANAPQQQTTFSGLVNQILGLINIIIPTVFALVFLYIVWKVIDAWVINGGDSDKREEGRQLVLIGVIVFVLMLVTWGVVALLRTTFFG